MSEPERAIEFRPDLVEFGTSFVRSDSFRELFREGMALVEDTAAYLDGEGRTESSQLGRTGALAYASESMRLTTRLMQIASWLLVQRAVAEGEITPAQAAREKDRVRLVPQIPSSSSAEHEQLPEHIRGLVESSFRLHARVMHLDRLICGVEVAGPETSPVAEQQGLLRNAFGIAS